MISYNFPAGFVRAVNAFFGCPRGTSAAFQTERPGRSISWSTSTVIFSSPAGSGARGRNGNGHRRWDEGLAGDGPVVVRGGDGGRVSVPHEAPLVDPDGA